MLYSNYFKDIYYNAISTYKSYDLYADKKKISAIFLSDLFNKNNGMYGGKSYKYKNYNFIVMKSKNNNDTVFVIGKEQHCLRATLANNNNTIVIQTFGYYPTCSEGKKMERKIGTNGVMKTFINYIKKKYKNNVKKIILSDNAYITCNKKNIQMSLYYFFKYGKLYYEKYGFELYSNNENELNDIKKRIKTYKTKYIEKNQFVKKDFFKYFKLSIKPLKNNKNIYDEYKLIKNKLTQYNSYMIFLQNYKFQDCVLFDIFIKLLAHNFQIDLTDLEYVYYI